MTSEGQSARDCRRAISPYAQYRSPVSYTNLIVSKSGETIDRRCSRVSGLLARTLLQASAVGGLALATRLTRGSMRTSIQRLPEFVGASAVVVTATRKIFSNLRAKPTEGHASGRFG